MNVDRWQRIAQVFSQAQAVPAGERARLLDSECGTDVALREEVVSLLSADHASNDFLARPALDQLARLFAADGWNLREGERVGAYQVTRLLGAGGGGEVWRARDERLGRDVAIKVLLRHWAADATRVRRFAEEAQAAGALNHPNVLTVFDVGEIRGIPYLVSEYLQGRSLRERLAAGAMSPMQAARVAREVALGLSVAHARGIIHRDLKPENLFLRDDEGVKILDFGLAKLESSEGILPAGPALGTLAGTAAYMAPEQIQGAVADARTDLFALGVVLYELLTARHPFRAANTVETLQAILTVEPPRVNAVEPRVPGRLARIVERLLQKNPALRFQSAADLAWALEPFARGDSDDAPASGRRASRRAWKIGGAAAAAMAGLIVGRLFLREEAAPAASPPLTQFTWPLPDGLVLESAPMVSPDGRRIAFIGGGATDRQLYVHDLDSLDAQAVPASIGAQQPFWSPDGRQIGFFAQGHLKKVQWPGGAPVQVTPVGEARGGAWSAKGRLLFAPDLFSGLDVVSVDGGHADVAAMPDAAKSDNSLLWPMFLPDGRQYLFVVRAFGDERRGLYLGQVDGHGSTPTTPLLRTDSSGVLAPLPGQDVVALFTSEKGRAEVRRLDLRTMTLERDARALPFPVGGRAPDQPIMLSASADVLAYATSGIPRGRRLEVYGRDGGRERRAAGTGQDNWPRLSPDGERIAYQRVDWLRGNPDLWVDDLRRGTHTRVTTDTAPDIQPVWSPDGAQIVYANGAPPGRGGPHALRIAAADGTGVARTIACPTADYCEPSDWSGDGKRLLVTTLGETDANVWLVELDGAGPMTRVLLDAAYAERDARFSPDGHWIVYVSEEAGRSEVSVRQLAGAPRRLVVSPDGGDQPVWRRDGRELFYVDPQGRLRSAAVSWQGGVPAFGLPELLPVPPVGFGHWNTQYDVSADGRQIFMLRFNDDPAPREIGVVVGWRRWLD